MSLKKLREERTIPKILRVNQQIRAREVHLIDEEEKSQGIVSLDQALLIAYQRGYDLVEVASTYPPVCRLLDSGKYKYQLEKEERKRKTKKLEVKEIRMRLSIEPHDLEIKKSKIEDFLQKGHKVKITLLLRGREKAFLERAYQFLERLRESLGEGIKKEKEAERLGNRISVLLYKTPHQ